MSRIETTAWRPDNSVPRRLSSLLSRKTQAARVRLQNASRRGIKTANSDASYRSPMLGRTLVCPFTDLLHTRHRVNIHKLPVAERVLAKGAFDLEAEFAIQRDPRLIIRENGQFESRKV